MVEPEIDDVPFTRASREALELIASETWETYEADPDNVPDQQSIAVAIARHLLAQRQNF